MIRIKLDTSRVEKQIDEMARRQIPFAMKNALNDTRKDVIAEIEEEIETSFDRPTPWTRRAFWAAPATKSKLSIEIRRKTPQRGRHYLEVQQAGGVRPQTGMERLLSSRLKYGGIVQSVTPAKGARINSYGNWSPGQRNQVFSAVQAQGDARSNTTAASKGRKRGRAGYFVPRAGSKLSPGIYQRMARGKVKKIVHITGASARYTKRFKFYEVTGRAVRTHLPIHFMRRFKQALKTAR